MNGLRGTATSLLVLATLFPSIASAALISHYKAEGNALDSAGSNHGTLHNGVGFAPGKFGQAFDFDGTNDYVSVPDDATLDITSALTISAWIRPEALGLPPDASVGIVWKGNNIQVAPNQSYGLLWFNDRTQLRLGGSFITGLNSGSLPFNEFTHVAGTYDGSEQRLYVNGVLVASSTTVPTSLNATNFPLFIGASGSGVNPFRFFNGRVDDLRIYDSALTGSEIEALSTIPEPSSLVLITLGGVGLLGRRPMRRCRTPEA